MRREPQWMTMMEEYVCIISAVLFSAPLIPAEVTGVGLKSAGVAGFQCVDFHTILFGFRGVRSVCGKE